MKNGKHNIKIGKVIGNRKKCRPSRAKSALEKEKFSNLLLIVLNHLNMSNNLKLKIFLFINILKPSASDGFRLVEIQTKPISLIWFIVHWITQSYLHD